MDPEYTNFIGRVCYVGGSYILCCWLWSTDHQVSICLKDLTRRRSLKFKVLLWLTMFILVFNFDKFQMSTPVPAILLFAPNVVSSLSSDCNIRPKYDRCQYIWIICIIGCHGSWGVCPNKRLFWCISFKLLDGYDTPIECYRAFYKFYCYHFQIASQNGGFGGFGSPLWCMLRMRHLWTSSLAMLGVR